MLFLMFCLLWGREVGVLTVPSVEGGCCSCCSVVCGGGGEVGVLTVPLRWRGVAVLAVLLSVGGGGEVGVLTVPLR
jgi:hypothetical protein